MPDPETMQDLNARAARLMWPKANIDLQDSGMVFANDEHFAVYVDFEDDLNDAAALWRAAPEEVKAMAIVDLEIKPNQDQSPIIAFLDKALDPAALTKAVVETWEAFNANR